jgi:hypothetical protein
MQRTHSYEEAVNTIPAKPLTDSDEAWLDWANMHFPYNEEFADRVRTSRFKPKRGSFEELQLIATVPTRTRGFLARLWFRGQEFQADIEKAQEIDRGVQREKEKTRLVSLAKEALAGNLGYTQQQKNDSRATAQASLHEAPESCSWEALSDWFVMHRYGKAVAIGRNPPRPTLYADRAKSAEMRREVDEIDSAIGSSQGAFGW